MARARTDFPSADAIYALADAMGRLPVRVAPAARADGIRLPPADRPQALLMSTTAPPEGGKANEIVLALLAKAIGCPPSALALLRGGASRTKVVQLPPRPQARS